MKYIYKLFSKDSCAPVLGQIALDVMAKPPQPGDPSYPLYSKVRRLSAPPLFKKTSSAASFCLLQEVQNIRNTMARNLKRVSEVVNSLPGVTCQPVEGGAFAFPRVHFPPKAIQKAEVITQNTQKQSKSLFYYMITDFRVVFRSFQELGMKPDTFYCMKILEEVGLLLSPGCDFDQKSGTHHIRCTIVNPRVPSGPA